MDRIMTPLRGLAHTCVYFYNGNTPSGLNERKRTLAMLIGEAVW